MYFKKYISNVGQDMFCISCSYAECLIVENPKKAVEVIMKYSKDLRSSGTGSTSLKHKLQVQTMLSRGE
jgi:hypothetical protein